MDELFPPGYRFFPTEEELVGFYLQNKLENKREEDMERVIPVVHVYSVDPWHLLDLTRVPSTDEGDQQWFFFCPRQERETQGGRPSRTTPSGYWKATGSPSAVYSSANRPLGMKKSMVFYQGKAPIGTKSKWKLNEYRAYQEDGLQLRSEFSLCRLYNSSGLRHFDKRPLMNPTIVENQIGSNKKTTIDVGVSSSKKKISNDNSSSDGGDCQLYPLDHIEKNEQSKVDDEGYWDFWISYDHEMNF